MSLPTEPEKQPKEQQIELLIQKGIRETEDNLVLWIQSALDKKESYGDLQEAQFRNLVRVADTTESPEVIKNFLLYQVGREKKWGRGKGSLAETIIKDIDSQTQQAAEKISKKISDLPKELQATYLKNIWLQLIRRYLGYGARYLKYLNSLKEGDRR